MPPTHAAFGRFRLSTPLPPGNPQQWAAKWRGAVASMFAHDAAFHGHEGDRTVARYPLVQYRWIDHAPAVFALGDAAERVMAHRWLGTEVRLGEHDVRITQVDWSTRAITRAFSRKLVRYEFHAPWIALNQANHLRFKDLDGPARRMELDRILVGNLLSMSQTFEWFFSPDETVYAAFEPIREVPTLVKGVPLIGFEGSFVTNLDLPDGLALGRSVSHGFGWFQRMNSG